MCVCAALAERSTARLCFVLCAVCSLPPYLLSMFLMSMKLNRHASCKAVFPIPFAKLMSALLRRQSFATRYWQLCTAAIKRLLPLESTSESIRDENEETETPLPLLLLLLLPRGEGDDSKEDKAS